MNVFEIIESLNDNEVKTKFDNMIESDDLDERMDICNEIISDLWYLETEDEECYPDGFVLPENFDYDEFQTKLKDICIG